MTQTLPDYAKELLSAEVPRATRAKSELITGLAVLPAIMLAVFVCAILMETPDLLGYRALLERGQPGFARIEQFYDTTYKSSVTHHMRYRYGYGAAEYQAEDVIDSSLLAHYRVGGTVPITLDPTAPGKSLVTPRGMSTIREKIHQRWLGLKIIAGIFLPMIALWSGYFLIRFYRQRRLLKWGTPVRARIVSRQLYSVKGTEFIRLFYEFSHRGQMFSGKRDSVRADDLRTLARFDVLPIVLYAPGDPSWNGLYPFSLVELKPPPAGADRDY